MISYRHIVDNRNNETGYIFIRRPPCSLGLWNSVKRKYNGKILGLSSHRDFPKNYPDVIKECSGWCHVFREPNLFGIPEDIPQILLGSSDFVLYNKIKIDKKFDICYICKESSSQKRIKRLNFFKECLPIFKKMKLKCVLIGRRMEGVISTGPVSHSKVLESIASSRFCFVPSILDASPRVLSESFSMDVPCLVNKSILGGWKYINNKTGEFFDDINDIKQACEKIISTQYNPRDWYSTNFGPIKSGCRLLSFMKDIYPNDKNLKKLSYVLIGRTGGVRNGQ